MDRKAKAKKIQKILNELFPDPPIPLKHHSPYTLLIAVLLSAQCTDARVNKVTPKLFERADTPEEMASLTIPEIQEIIKTCGLSAQKAKAIHQFSKILLEKYDGQVPDTFDDLESLPGVGHKTASVVMAQSFKKAAFPVDTHIHRLANRWGLTHSKQVKQTEKDLKKLFPKKDWIKVHLQLIYYARTYCPARNHKIENCPICSDIL